MRRRHLLFLLLTLPALAVILWQWFLKPYDPAHDGAGGCRMESARLERDRSYHWLKLTLQITDPAAFRLRSPVQLRTASGAVRTPAGIDLQGGRSQAPETAPVPGERSFSLTFWLEPGDLDGPLELALGPARLPVRDGSAPPALADGASRTYHSVSW